MHAITATFEVVTPMFLGGADNKSKAELRTASIKGQLRFWWRALAWSRIAAAHGGVDVINKLREDEGRIFGSSAHGRGRFLLGIVKSDYVVQLAKDQAVLRDSAKTVVGSGARYLGYGLMTAFDIWKKDGIQRDRRSEKPFEYAGQLSRPCIREGGIFSIRLHFGGPAVHKNPSEVARLSREYKEDYASVLDTLKLFGLLGGVGARTRRGWGSVALVGLAGDGVDPKWLPPKDADEYAGRIKDLLAVPALCASVPDYSAFFNQARVLILHTNTAALDALDELGGKFQLFRGWRHPSGNPEKNFKFDHDGKTNGAWNIVASSFEAAYPASHLQHPLRVALGLPHNYSQRLKIEAEIHDRRGSPLLFHIHRIGNKFAATATVFPTRFLPDVTSKSGSRPEHIKIINGHHGTSVKNQVDYRIIDAFLDGFTTAGGQIRKYFSAPQRIL